MWLKAISCLGSWDEALLRLGQRDRKRERVKSFFINLKQILMIDNMPYSLLRTGEQIQCSLSFLHEKNHADWTKNRCVCAVRECVRELTSQPGALPRTQPIIGHLESPFWEKALVNIRNSVCACWK